MYFLRPSSFPTLQDTNFVDTISKTKYYISFIVIRFGWHLGSLRIVPLSIVLIALVIA